MAQQYVIAAEYYGLLNLDQPELGSDLFFLRSGSLKGEDVVLTFHLPQDPLDQAKYELLRKHGVAPLVRDCRATTLPIKSAPLYWDKPRASSGANPYARKKIFESYEQGTIRRYLREFSYQADYWERLYASCGARIYTHWHKYSPDHVAIYEAMQRLGGIMTLYQRAFESHPSTDTILAADVYFSFSRDAAVVEKANGSAVSYIVTTGYLGDYRFDLLKNTAREIREKLLQRGVKHIISFFDENTLDDGRWFFGHHFTQRNYAFLIEKAMQDPSLGIIFKPKIPRTLRRRLGPVAGALETLLSTGRAYLFDQGEMQSSYPPCAAAMAADLAIHESACAGTAAVEAALAGVKTLVLDMEGWHVSPFYKMGRGRVVFNDWETLWKACREAFQNPRQHLSLGDWSSILNDIDPFRDGRAAERMGTYLRWLLDGLRAGYKKEEVLAAAADRYAQMWGSDKVVKIS